MLRKWSFLRQFLVAPKDKSEKDITGPPRAGWHTGPIYSIHCRGQTNRGQCEFYIGETERSLKARFLEHRRPSSTSLEVPNISTLSLRAMR